MLKKSIKGNHYIANKKSINGHLIVVYVYIVIVSSTKIDHTIRSSDRKLR